MAAPLERLDSIRDSLINRGLGTSGLTRQAIQRANLPELGAAIAESRATQANAQRSRLAEFASRQSLLRPSGAGSGGARGGGGGVPVIINKTQGTGPIGTGSGFTLNTSGGGELFNSIQELVEFAKHNPAILQNVAFSGAAGVSGLSQQEREILRRQLGVDIPDVDFRLGQQSIGQTADFGTFQDLVAQSKPVVPAQDKTGAGSTRSSRLDSVLSTIETELRAGKNKKDIQVITDFGPTDAETFLRLNRNRITKGTI